jgi:hypothetical protein
VGLLKTSFSRTTELEEVTSSSLESAGQFQSNSIKFGTNHSWVKGILYCSNKGPGPLHRRDNHKNTKMGWRHLKIFFSRTNEPEELIFT